MPVTGRAARVRILLVLGVLAAFGPLSMDMYLPALPHISADLSAGQVSTQLTMSACVAGLALGQLAIGPISDLVGRRRPLLIGVGSYVVLSLLCAVAPNVGVLIALRFLQGVAGSAGLVLSRAMVRDLYGGGRDAARMYSLLILVSGTGPILSPLIGGQVLRFTSWRGIFVVLAGLGVVILVGAASLGETYPKQARHGGGLRATGRAFGTLVHDRSFVCLTLTIGLAASALFTYVSTSPFVIEDAYGRSAQLFSFVFASNACGIVVWSQVGARLVRRVGSGTLLRWGLIQQCSAGTAVLVLTVAMRPPLFVLLIPLFFIVSAVGLIFPNATALALSRHGTIAGAASAQVGAFQFLLGALASPIAGVGGHSAIVPMGIVITVCALAATATGFLARAKELPSMVDETPESAVAETS